MTFRFDMFLHMAESFDDMSQWLERLSALHRSLMRRFAAEEGLQLVHVEILRYLSICNRYSDTTQALSEYLGQTKGSISQSLGYLEEDGLIKRNQDRVDRRIFHLVLTMKGRLIARKSFDLFRLEGDDDLKPGMKSILSDIQRQNGLKGFGVCISCKYNQNPGRNSFVCGLTKEKLSFEDVKKICKEHEPLLGT